jgi:hypothetical protein
MTTTRAGAAGAGALGAAGALGLTSSSVATEPTPATFAATTSTKIALPGARSLSVSLAALALSVAAGVPLSEIVAAALSKMS